MQEDIVKRVYALGFKNELEKGSCAQCTLAAIDDVLSVGNGGAFKAAGVFGGGGGRMGTGNCGAYTGGLIAIGLKYGRSRQAFNDRGPRASRSTRGSSSISDFTPKLQLAHKLVRQLHEKFREAYGSIICRDIQRKIYGKSFDLWDEKEWIEFNDVYGAHRDKGDEPSCPTVVGKAAMWTAEILLNAENRKVKL